METVDQIMKKLEGHGIDTVDKAFPGFNGSELSMVNFDRAVFVQWTDWELRRRCLPGMSPPDWRIFLLKVGERRPENGAMYPVPYWEADLRELVEWCVAIDRMGADDACPS